MPSRELDSIQAPSSETATEVTVDNALAEAGRHAVAASLPITCLYQAYFPTDAKSRRRLGYKNTSRDYK